MRRTPALRGSIDYTFTPPLDVLTEGLRVSEVTCNNRTTGQSIIIQTGSSAFDCRQEGLQVNPGDSIDIRIQSVAE